MDTRFKIITVDTAVALAAAGRPAVLMTGHFDVLLAAHIRDLSGAREKFSNCTVIVALTPPTHPVLEARARAEMVAALGMVDYVVSLEEPQTERLLAAFAGMPIVRLETVHQQRMRELIQHVQRRQSP